MTMLQVAPPYPVFADLNGSPLDAGYIYLGMVNLNPETDPIQVFWDESLSLPAAQPIRTIGGLPSRNGSPGTLYTDGTYSITIKDKAGRTVYSSPIGYSVTPSTVAASTQVVTVAANIGSVNALAGDMDNIIDVRASLGAIDTCAADLGGVWNENGVYDFGSIADPAVGPVSPPTGNISVVAADIDNVNIDAANIASIITVATNISAILASVAGALQRANNLSDLTSVSTARTNLGLGGLATKTLVTSSDLDSTIDLGTIT
jgi:hypothetical protein